MQLFVIDESREQVLWSLLSECDNTRSDNAARLVWALRDSGWNVLFVAVSSPRMSDTTLLPQPCYNAPFKILLPEDKDFGELIPITANFVRTSRSLGVSARM